MQEKSNGSLKNSSLIEEQRKKGRWKHGDQNTNVVIAYSQPGIEGIISLAGDKVRKITRDTNNRMIKIL